MFVSFPSEGKTLPDAVYDIENKRKARKRNPEACEALNDVLFLSQVAAGINRISSGP